MVQVETKIEKDVRGKQEAELLWHKPRPMWTIDKSKPRKRLFEDDNIYDDEEREKHQERHKGKKEGKLAHLERVK